MNPIKTTAHQAGWLYFVFMVVAIYREFLAPRFVVAGDAAATARNIAGAETSYRLVILTGFVTLVLFLLVVERLHKLLAGVDRGLAMQMVLLVAVGVAAAVANLLLQLAPLVLLGNADELSAFPRAQLEALSLGSLRLHARGAGVISAFWGLWLFPFGVLVTKSRFLPRILGILLVIAGVGYLVGSVTLLIAPEHRQLVTRIVMPLYFGEVPIIFWLLIRGASEPRSRE